MRSAPGACACNSQIKRGRQEYRSRWKAEVLAYKPIIEEEVEVDMVVVMVVVEVVACGRTRIKKKVENIRQGNSTQKEIFEYLRDFALKFLM